MISEYFPSKFLSNHLQYISLGLGVGVLIVMIVVAVNWIFIKKTDCWRYGKFSIDWNPPAPESKESRAASRKDTPASDDDAVKKAGSSGEDEDDSDDGGNDRDEGEGESEDQDEDKGAGGEQSRHVHFDARTSSNASKSRKAFTQSSDGDDDEDEDDFVSQNGFGITRAGVDPATARGVELSMDKDDADAVQPATTDMADTRRHDLILESENDTEEHPEPQRKQSTQHPVQLYELAAFFIHLGI